MARFIVSMFREGRYDSRRPSPFLLLSTPTLMLHFVEMIIRTVAMTLVVADIDAALGDISQIATGTDGAVSAQSNQSSGDRLGKMTLRVPNSRLQRFAKVLVRRLKA